MGNYGLDYVILNMHARELLKDDNLEEAMQLVIDFIEKHLPKLAFTFPQKYAISVSAKIARINRATQLGLLDWSTTNAERSQLLGAILDLLELLERGNNEIERRGSPHISGPPVILMIESTLERLERVLKVGSM